MLKASRMLYGYNIIYETCYLSVIFILFQMHGYPDSLGPGCRLPPPPHLPHHDLMYGPPPPDMGPLPPPPDPSCSPEDWSRADPPPGTTDQLFAREGGEGEFSYLDTSDDSGRHTGPDPSSP